MGVVRKCSVLCRVLGLMGFLDQYWQQILKFSPNQITKATINSTGDSVKSKYS